MRREASGTKEEHSEATTGGTTRRAALRTASVGLAAVTGVTTAAAAESCVTKPELRALRDSYATEHEVVDAVTNQTAMLSAVQDAGLYESDHLAVYVTAAAQDCESAPRIDALRRPTDGGVLTMSVDPVADEAYALYNSGSTIEEIHNPTDPCFLTCASPCCSCEAVVCYDDPDFYGPPCPYSIDGPTLDGTTTDDVTTDDVVCTPYCWKCQCPEDRWDCIDVLRVEPVEVEMSSGWLPQPVEA